MTIPSNVGVDGIEEQCQILFDDVRVRNPVERVRRATGGRWPNSC